MASGEVAFLKDQVKRLNAVLSKYQRKYPPLPEEDQPRDDIQAPWLSDQRLLAPLLIEYDTIINELEDQLNVYKDGQRSLRQEVDRLLAENNRLNVDFKDSLESQLHQIDDQQSIPADHSDGQLIRGLQQQLQLVTQEKETIEGMWKKTEQEMERLQRQLQEEKNSHQWKIVEEQAHTVRGQYERTTTELTAEIERLNADLRKTKSDLNSSHMQLADLQRLVDEFKTQLQWKEAEKSDALFKEGITESKVASLYHDLEDLKHKYSQASKEIEDIKTERDGLQSRMKEMQKKTLDSESRENDAILQVREAVQMVENCILEKDQAEITVKQREEEIDKLQDVINKLINEAGVRTRKEVDTVRKQCNDSITKIMEELHAMEMENTEKQAQQDRMLREKRAVESELESIYKEGLAAGSKDKGAYEDINRRAINAERGRDDAELQLESLQNIMKREQMGHEQQRQQSETQITQLRDRMAVMDLEFENMNDDRMKLVNEIDALKSKLQAAQKERDTAQRNCYKEMTMMDQDQKLKLREFEVKLQSTEDANRHAMIEVRKLLTAQQRMSARWKEECQTIAYKFEIKVNDLRSEVSSLKKRNDEMVTLLRDSQEKTLEAERTMSEYTRNIQRMEERVRETEIRAALSAKQVSRQLIRDRQLANEQKSILKDAERSYREDNLLHSSRIIPEPLLFGDLVTNGNNRMTSGHHNSSDGDSIHSDR